MSQLPKKQRLEWVDVAKGVAIILVVLGHALRGLAGSDIVPTAVYQFLDSRIYAFHMPVFFALSGYFAVPVLARLTPAAYVRQRVIRLIYPMVLWTYLFLAAKVAAGPYANSAVSMKDLVVSPFPGLMHMWFLWALFIISTAFLLARPFLKGASLSAPVLGLMFAGSVCLTFVPLPEAVIHWAGEAIYFAPFFCIGIVLQQSGLLTDRSARDGIIVSALFLVVIACWPLIEGLGVARLASMVLTVAFLMVFSLARNIEARPTMRMLSRLGQASMAIYLMHTIFSAGLREALFVAGVSDWSIHLLLGTLIGVAGPVIVYDIAKHWGLSRPLGL